MYDPHKRLRSDLCILIHVKHDIQHFRVPKTNRMSQKVIRSMRYWESVSCIWESYHEWMPPVCTGFYLPPVTHTNPSPFSLGYNESMLRASPSTAPLFYLCSRVCIALTQPHVEYWVYSERLCPVKLGSEFLLMNFHFSYYRCVWYDRWTCCTRTFIAPWLC